TRGGPRAARAASGSALGEEAPRSRALRATGPPRPQRRGPRRSWWSCRRVLELCFFRRAPESQGRRLAAGNGLDDAVEVARADLTLVPGRGVAVFFQLELSLLEPDVGRHAFIDVALRKVEHPGVQRVEPRERDELEAVAHLAESV